MAKHEIIIHENTGALKESAPYLGTYITKETVRLAGYAEQVAAKCGLPAIQVQAIITGAFEAWEELELEALTRIHTDLGTICGTITGSFPTSDAPFDPAVNALELALRLDDTIRLALSDVTPTVSTDESITKLRLDNVVDVATVKPYNLIHGAGDTRLQGFNMVSTDSDWEAYFENTLGVRFPFVITEDVSKQLKIGHLDPAPAEGCDGKMVVKSKAGDPTGPLQTSFRKVKYLKVVAPDPVKVTKITSSGYEGEEGVIHAACFVYIEGENLKLDEDDCVAYSGTRGGSAVNGSFPASRLTENTETKLALDYMEITGDDFHFDNGSTVTLTIKGTNATATYRA